MNRNRAGKLALLWPRDAAKWHAATPGDYRLHRVFDAVAALGIEAEPALYADDVADRGARAASALRRRAGLGRSALATGATASCSTRCCGTWRRAVCGSARHPDVILKMGVKEVLHRTRHLGWGTDTHLYRDVASVPRRVSAAPADGGAAGPEAEPRQWRRRACGRSNSISDSGRDDAIVRVLHARRGSVPEGAAARRFHEPVRTVFRDRRLHRRSAVPAAPARRHDPLLHGRGQGRRLRPPAHQGADPAAARRSGLDGGAAGSAHHASGCGADSFRR